MKKLFILIFSVFCAFLCLTSTDEAYALTTNATAQSIELNQQYEGVIPKVNTKHYYRFTLPEDGQVEFSMKNLRGTVWQAYIYDLQGQKLDFFSTSSKDFAQAEESVKTGLAAGSYYVVIDEYIGAVGETYSFSVDFTAGQFYEKEYNNTVALANAIQFDKTYEGNIHTRDDDDFYKITLPKNGNVTLTMPNVSGAGWKISVMDGNGKLITAQYTNSKNTAAGNATNQVGLPKGTHYIQITPVDTKTNEVPYKLTVSFKASEFYEKEFNETLATANPIKLNAVTFGRTEYKTSKDHDFYKFVVPTNGNVRVSMTQLAGARWNLKILDSNGKSVHAYTTDSSSKAKKNYEKTLNLKKGTYYFQVSEYVGTDYKSYQIKVTQITPTPAAKNVVVKNNKGQKDTITVKGITKGATVKVFNASSKQIATVKATSTTATLSVSQLGKKAGKVFVTVQDANKVVSARLTVNFSAEK